MADAAVTTTVSLSSTGPNLERLRGLVWGVPDEKAVKERATPEVWWRRPVLLGSGALVLVVILDVVFA